MSNFQTSKLWLETYCIRITCRVWVYEMNNSGPMPGLLDQNQGGGLRKVNFNNNEINKSNLNAHFSFLNGETG